MKKKYMTPEMEILDTELEGVILTASQKEEDGYVGGDDNPNLGRQDGLGFDEDEEDF